MQYSDLGPILAMVNVKGDPSPNDSRLWLGSDKVVRIFDYATEKIVGSFSTSVVVRSMLHCTPSQDVWIGGRNDNLLHIYHNRPPYASRISLSGHTGPILHLDMIEYDVGSGEKEGAKIMSTYCIVASCSFDQSVIIWNARTKEKMQTLVGVHCDSIRTSSFLHILDKKLGIGMWLASRDRRISMWISFPEFLREATGKGRRSLKLTSMRRPVSRVKVTDREVSFTKTPVAAQYQKKGYSEEAMEYINHLRAHSDERKHTMMQKMRKVFKIMPLSSGGLGSDSPPPGDLVIFRSYFGQMFYGRIAAMHPPENEDEGAEFSIYVSPMENSIEVVPFDSIVVFTPPMKAMLGDKREVQKLVYDPVDEFFSVMSEDILVCSYEFLINQNLNLQLVRECTINPAPMKQLIELKRIHAVLMEYSRSPPQELIEKVRNLSEVREV
tara:strand:- start:1310 stop:2626 length:1317 start_codon:yes stop_codon:yes gene_type:complete